MYKLLLCVRYLKTRYLAMACIISVMLGVATLIVVNSVMNGFSTKLRDKLHSVMSDIVIESLSMDGFDGPEQKMEQIRRDKFLGPRVAAMTASMEIFAMLQYDYPNGERVIRPVRLIGVDEKTRSTMGGFREHLVLQNGKAEPNFDLPEDQRRQFEEHERRLIERQAQEAAFPEVPDGPPPPAPPPSVIKIPCGAVIGNLIASYRKKVGENKYVDEYVLKQGHPVYLMTVAGAKMAPVIDRFVVVDYFKSEMAEHDGNQVYVPLAYLQKWRSMEDRVGSIQIKLRDYGDAKAVVEALQSLFPPPFMNVATWEEKQGPLLAAISIEKGILNVLLFLIVGVAGFGILAIFSMIVAEKTRDIGILKALGASSFGVMKIFLTYGLLLGLVGTSLGSLLGVLITNNINGVERLLAHLTGGDIFDRKVYYFSEIPIDTQASMVLMVNGGALLIAVLFSVLPALRAARLHPVRALRYE